MEETTPVEEQDPILQLIEDQKKKQEILAADEMQEQAETAALESGERIDEDDTQKTLDPSEFGLKENLQELVNVGLGAVRDEARNIVTAPERLLDLATGEYQRQLDETGQYKLDFDFLGGVNPQTRTKWGKISRGILGYASFAIPVAGIAGKVSKGVGVFSKYKTIQKLAGKTLASKNPLIAGATQGFVHDVIAESSQEDNILGMLKKGPLKDSYPAFLDPLATNDDDSPVMKTLKNVVESMGVGIIFDGVYEGMKYTGKSMLEARAAANNPNNQALKKATDGDPISSEVEASREVAETKIDEVMTEGEYIEAKRQKRNQSIQDQQDESAAAQMSEEGFRANKNSSIADDHQGNATSNNDIYEATKTLKRKHVEYASEDGSVDYNLTNAQAERSANEGGLPPEFYREKAKELLGDRRFQQLLKELKKKKLDINDVFKESYDSYQQIVSGRNPAELDPEVFWKQIIESDPFQTGGKDNQTAWAMENVIVADLVNASLFTKLRDLAIGAKENMSWADIKDIDGPVKQIRDNLILGLYNVKRSRYLISDQFRSLRAQDPKSAKQAANEALAGLRETTKTNVDMMMELATKSNDQSFVQAVMEAFSMSNKIENWMDFDAFMKRRLRGFSADQAPSDLIRELQGVMINSVLSGPKTPLRALMGTSVATAIRPMAELIGGVTQYVGSGFKDDAIMRESLATSTAMVQAVPEAMQFFFTRLKSYWSGDIHSFKSRYSNFDAQEDQWKLMGEWVEMRGSTGDKAAYRIANIARGANQSNFLTYSTKLMAATDDAFSMILSRGRARQLALRKAMDDAAVGPMVDVDPAMMRKYENEFYGEIFDPTDGSVSDAFLDSARKEVTLTRDLSGTAKAFEDLFNKVPALKPFYLFARTGVNGLQLSFKHVPGFNLLVDEFNDIWKATPDTLDAVRKYGIENAQDLASAKALQNGRLVLGSGIVMLASQAYLNGNLTGNGPQDYSTRKSWEDAGWIPRSIKLGDVWVSYDSLDPFSNMFAAIADVADNQSLMGNDEVEKHLLAQAIIMSKGLISKTYLQGFQQLVDLFGNDPKRLPKFIASLANNTMPLSSLRNEIGRIITPYQRELQSGLEDSIRNRNLFFEQATTDPLPIKYDIMTGDPIKNWNPMTRIFNAISPINFNFDQSVGRKFLFKSNYDMRISTMTAPDNTNLRNSPSVRSKFQQQIGLQGLGKKLDEIATMPEAIASMERMKEDLKRNGGRGIDPMKYRHNELIHNAFTLARSRAWANLQKDPEVYALMRAEQLQRGAMYNLNNRRELSQQQLDRRDELLNLVNR